MNRLALLFGLLSVVVWVVPQRAQPQYPTHPHFVWGLVPSFFKAHRTHSDQEVVDNAIAILLGIGDYCWHEGFHYQVIRIQKACVELDPQFSEAYENAAWLLVSYNRKEEALALLQRYLRENPNRYEPYYEIGWFYYHWQKQPAEAIPWLEKALRFPHPPIIEHTLAHAYERVGRLEEALAVWENKLKRYPNDLVAKRQVERLRQLLQQKR